jgi:hypothetical protein
MTPGRAAEAARPFSCLRYELGDSSGSIFRQCADLMFRGMETGKHNLKMNINKLKRSTSPEDRQL